MGPRLLAGHGAHNGRDGPGGRPGAWARACWRATAHRRSLLTPAVFDGDRLAGLLPLAAEGRTLRFLGHGHSDYNDFLCDDAEPAAALESALRALLSAPVRWRRCILENVPEPSHLRAHWDHLPADLQARSVVAPGAVCWALSLGEEREGALAGVLGKGKLRYYQNRLRKQGTLIFRHIEDRAEVHAHLPGFFRMYRARRALAGDTDRDRHERLRALFEALADELDPGVS